MRFLLCAAGLCLLGGWHALHARVIRIEQLHFGSVLNGQSFGTVGSYEFITAKVHFAVDPKVGPNRIITDIDLAPKNDRGLVEFSADLYMLRPKQQENGNGTAIVEVSNRGGKALPLEFDFGKGPLNPNSVESLGDDFLLNHGFTLVWVGWEFDVPPRPGLLHAYLPVATFNGAPITGIVRSEWIGDRLETVIPLGDKGQIGYEPSDPNSPENKLFVRDDVKGPRTLIDRTKWRFVDSTHAQLEGGFAPGRIYEVVYRAKNPPVAGLGLAAVRDFVSYLKHPDSGSPLLEGQKSLQRAIGFGVSQTGRFLREFLYDGFNQDENGRKVFDGVWAHVAGAGRGSFNERFAQPSRDGHPFLNVFYPVDVPPFDEERLLARAHHDGVEPKLYLTNGSYEYWGRCASLIHTTQDGKADAPPSTNTRIYFFSGSQHTVGNIPPAHVAAQNAANTNDYRYALRALLLGMQAWLERGTAPPGSHFPLLKKSELTDVIGLRFPAIPGVNRPDHKREAYRLDFSVNPPAVGNPFPSFVPRVDNDGNELGGIRMPEIQVPLASYTGWNLRDPATGAPTELVAFYGSWIPFCKTKVEEKTARDPRQSIAERYSSQDDYLRKIDSVTADLVQQGFLLEEDEGSIHRRAATEWEYRMTLK